MFRTVSLPLMAPGLANAFLVGFVESIADFGNPLVLGGNLRCSPPRSTSRSSARSTTRAARRRWRSILLGLALGGLPRPAARPRRPRLHDRHRQGRGRASRVALPAALRRAALAVGAAVARFTVVVYGMALVGGFVAELGPRPLVHAAALRQGVRRGVGGRRRSSGRAAPGPRLEHAAARRVAAPLSAGVGLLTAYLLGARAVRRAARVRVRHAAVASRCPGPSSASPTCSPSTCRPSS